MSAKAKTVILLFSIALNVAFLAGWGWRAIRPAPGPGTRPHEARAHSLHENLDLTSEQRGELEPRLEQFRREIAATFSRLNRGREEMIELLAAPEPDTAMIRAKQLEIQDGQRRCQELLIAHVLAEKQVLSPIQQRKYFDLLRQKPGARLPERVLGEPNPQQAGPTRSP